MLWNIFYIKLPFNTDFFQEYGRASGYKASFDFVVISIIRD